MQRISVASGGPSSVPGTAFHPPSDRPRPDRRRTTRRPAAVPVPRRRSTVAAQQGQGLRGGPASGGRRGLRSGHGGHPSRTVVGPVDSPRADGEIPPRPRRTRAPGRSRRPPERRFAGRTRDRRRGRKRELAVDVLGLIIGSSSTTPVRSSPTAASSPRAVSPSPPETRPDRPDQARPGPRRPIPIGTTAGPRSRPVPPGPARPRAGRHRRPPWRDSPAPPAFATPGRAVTPGRGSRRHPWRRR